MRKVTVETNGISYIEPVKGTKDWYWGNDYMTGDLYEFEEVIRDGGKPKSNRIVLVKYPEGQVFEPVKAKEGQYLEGPVYYEGRIYLMLVDFIENYISVQAIEPETMAVEEQTRLSLEQVEDCYNLKLDLAPLMVCQHTQDNRLIIYWPEEKEYKLMETEGFYFREDNRLYCTAWYEDPNYREEVIVRDYDTGEILERLEGGIQLMPDGSAWILK